MCRKLPTVTEIYAKGILSVHHGGTLISIFTKH